MAFTFCSSILLLLFMMADCMLNRNFLGDWPGCRDKAFKPGLSRLKRDVWCADFSGQHVSTKIKTVLDKPNCGHFQAITVHFINTKWKVRIFELANDSFSDKHRACNVDKSYDNVIKKGQINMKRNEAGVRWSYIYDWSISSLLHLLCCIVLSLFTHFFY